MQSTKSVAKKQELREELLRIEQQIQSEKAWRKRREVEKAAKVCLQPPLIPLCVMSVRLWEHHLTPA